MLLLLPLPLFFIKLVVVVEENRYFALIFFFFFSKKITETRIHNEITKSKSKKKCMRIKMCKGNESETDF